MSASNARHSPEEFSRRGDEEKEKDRHDYSQRADGEQWLMTVPARPFQSLIVSYARSSSQIALAESQLAMKTENQV